MSNLDNLARDRAVREAYALHQVEGHVPDWDTCENASCRRFSPELRRQSAALIGAEKTLDQVVDRAPADALKEWWMKTASQDVHNLAPKANEYGGVGPAHDLTAIGQTLARIAGKGEVSDSYATELGIFFYLRGKIARWETAVLSGYTPSDDTLLDIAVYAMMARRNRDAGGWPVGRKP